MKLSIRLTKNVTSPDAARAAPPQRRVEAERVLRLEIRVAVLDGVVAGMRPVEVQLLERRIPRRARATLNAIVVWSVGSSSRPTDPDTLVKSRAGSLCCGSNVGVLDAAAELDLRRAA